MRTPRLRTGCRATGSVQYLDLAVASPKSDQVIGSGDRVLLLAPALHRRRDLHRLTVFRDGAARDVDTSGAQPLDDGVVGQHAVRRLVLDELTDAVAHRLGGMRLAAVGGRDRGRKEIFELEDA